MKILVTGGAGYLGSVLSLALIEEGHHVRVLDNLMYGGRSLLSMFGHSRFELMIGDVRDSSAVERAVEHVDAVVHLAAVVGDPACARDPEAARAINQHGSLQLIRSAQAAGVKHFVFVSTCSNYGMTTHTWDRHRGHGVGYDVVTHGCNYRLDELHAALGRCQWRKLPGNNARRRRLVAIYRQALSALDGWITPFANHPGESACHLSVVVAPDTDIRDLAVGHLRAAGIQTSLHYPCIPGFGAFHDVAADGIERSQAFASRVITLPLFPTMTPDEVEETCRQLALVSDTRSRVPPLDRTRNEGCTPKTRH